ncbi:MAG: transposase [Planctomycetota bacterium]
MPRKPRVEYEGAAYHVMCRGDHGEPVYGDDADRLRFLDCLSEVCGRTGWIIHAYVLMDNHYHLLTETPQANLVSGMHWLQGTYTNRYNRRHRLHGHVFAGRYKPLLIDPENDTYFLQVSTYIHLNPIRAGLVKPRRGGLAKYRFSSYPLYLEPQGRRPDWLCVDRVFAALGLPDNARGRRAYADHLTERARQASTISGKRLQEKEWEDIRRGWCLGDENFRSRMKRRLDQLLGKHHKSSYSGPALRDHQRRTAAELLAAGLAAVGLDPQELATTRKTDPRKQAVAWLLRTNTTVRNRWVSSQLHMGHEVNVSQAVRLIAEAKAGQRARLRNAAAKTLKPKD